MRNQQPLRGEADPLAYSSIVDTPATRAWVYAWVWVLRCAGLLENVGFVMLVAGLYCWHGIDGVPLIPCLIMVSIGAAQLALGFTMRWGWWGPRLSEFR